jgi:predicted transcriptional regulator
LVYIVNGQRVLGYDNAEGKGHRRHSGALEEAYKFISLKKISADFIKDIQTALNEFVETGKSLQKGNIAKKDTGVYFTSVEAFRRALTPKRMEVLHTIRTQKPSSIHILSRMLNRDVKNIAMDVKYLAQVGLVEKQRSKDEKKDITPSVNYERIIFEINV